MTNNTTRMVNIGDKQKKQTPKKNSRNKSTTQGPNQTKKQNSRNKSTTQGPNQMKKKNSRNKSTPSRKLRHTAKASLTVFTKF